MNSGYVFFTNSEYQVAMCETNEHNKLELYSFYSSPYEGKEGSFDELLDEYEENAEAGKCFDNFYYQSSW